MKDELTSEIFFDVPIPEMPSVEEIGDHLFVPETSWKVKPYPSLYMNIKDRMRFWSKIVSKVEQTCELRVETKAVAIERHSDIFQVSLLTSDGVADVVYCKKVVLAGGRFMPLQNLLSNIATRDSNIFRRHEFGFRVQVPTSNAAIAEIRAFGLKDPKLVMAPSKDIEYRTFCFCVDGEVSKSCIDSLVTFSGRADVDSTGFTNFAILVRTKSPFAFLQDEIDAFLKSPFEFENRKAMILNRLSDCPSIAKLILAALDSLFVKFPALNCSDLRLFGPCLEGVGTYPNTDSHMKVKGLADAYAIGDTHGCFRGLVPSFLSGFYLAHVVNFEKNGPLLLTSSLGKHQEISNIIGPLQRFAVQDVSCNTVEEKVQKLFDQFKCVEQYSSYRELLIETTSLVIDRIGLGEPGLKIGEFFSSLGADAFTAQTIGSRATMECFFTLVDAKSGYIIKQVSGSTKGTMVSARGTNGFGWDAMFMPEGQEETFAEMCIEKKNWLSARSIAANKLFQS